MEDDVPEETVALRSDLRIVLGGLPLFQGLDDDILRDIAAEVEWLSLPGGAMLFATGEAFRCHVRRAQRLPRRVRRAPIASSFWAARSRATPWARWA